MSKNASKTRKSPIPTAGHSVSLRSSPGVVVPPALPTGVRAQQQQQQQQPQPQLTAGVVQNSPRLSASAPSSRDRQPSPKLPAQAAGGAKSGANNINSSSGSAGTNNISINAAAHAPSPKQQAVNALSFTRLVAQNDAYGALLHVLLN
jgi:hypothetical protein